MKKKTLSKLKNDLQVIFNKYIRLRDNDKPCVSCGKRNKLQAGHYFAVKNYDAFRFDERNVHGECAGCNCFDESHLIGYTNNISNRLTHEELESLHNEVTLYKQNRLAYKWDRPTILELIEIYKEKVLQLEKLY